MPHPTGRLPLVRLAAPRSTAIVAVTARGSALAQRLAAALLDSKRHVDSTAYVPTRFARTPVEIQHPSIDASSLSFRDGSVVAYSGRVAPVVADLFQTAQDLVLVMAAGAAVRLLAPLLVDKRTDPAVVLIDDAGRFAISLVSGHLGGANDLATRVGTAIGAQPIVTTASESAGVPAADLIGRELGWKIEPGSNLKRLAAALVNGDQVGVYQDTGSRDWTRRSGKARLTMVPTPGALVAADPAAAIVISDRVHDLPPALQSRTAVYRPPVLVLGVGCSSGAPARAIAELVDAALAQARLSPLSVSSVSTIDRKSDEPGLLAFVHERGLPLVTFRATELDQAPGEWNRSEVVQRAVGTGGVAEPAALLAAGTSVLLVGKRKSRQVTVAIARIEEAGDSRRGGAAQRRGHG